MKIKVRTERGAIIPQYKTEGAAGFDISSVEETTILPLQRQIIKTGLFFEIEKGYEVQIRPRSGNAAKDGVTVLNSPGTIDCDYRGEIMIILFNSSSVPFSVKIGDRIAQGVVAKAEQAEWEKADELSETERGAGGFGSTGK
jgi:dUTP pyrophosphatase